MSSFYVTEAQANVAAYQRLESVEQLDQALSDSFKQPMFEREVTLELPSGTVRISLVRQGEESVTDRNICGRALVTIAAHCPVHGGVTFGRLEASVQGLQPVTFKATKLESEINAADGQELNPLISTKVTAFVARFNANHSEGFHWLQTDMPLASAHVHVDEQDPINMTRV